jgi:uncharacterized delta-60 repeat protein
MVVTRLNAGGTPDATFGSAGRAVADFDGQEAGVGAALQADGKILVAGTTTADWAFAVARLDGAGALDASFGSGGRTAIGFGGVTLAGGAALQPDGRIVVAGGTEKDDVATISVLRLLGDPPPPATGGPQPSPAVVPRCAGRPATIVGTPRRDRLRGTPRADVIVALGGNDTVLARGGNDLVCGGAGNDRLSGGAGRDRLLGERGRDLLTGGRGRDRLIGGPGRDHRRP